jgi:hypothetical protein
MEKHGEHEVFDDSIRHSIQAHCFLTMYRWIKLDVVWGHDLNMFCSGGSKPVQSQVDILSCHILPCTTVSVHLIPEKETGFLPSLAAVLRLGEVHNGRPIHGQEPSSVVVSTIIIINYQY